MKEKNKKNRTMRNTIQCAKQRVAKSAKTKAKKKHFKVTEFTNYNYIFCLVFNETHLVPLKNF